MSEGADVFEIIGTTRAMRRLGPEPGGPELPPKVWGYPLRSGDRVLMDTRSAGGYGPRVRECRIDGSVEYVPVA
jgi:hypothetical protein